jgi:hypothetical protein
MCVSPHTRQPTSKSILQNQKNQKMQKSDISKTESTEKLLLNPFGCDPADWKRRDSLDVFEAAGASGPPFPFPRAVQRLLVSL